MAGDIASTAGLIVHEPDDGVVHFARWRSFHQNAVSPSAVPAPAREDDGRGRVITIARSVGKGSSWRRLGNEWPPAVVISWKVALWGNWLSRRSKLQIRSLRRLLQEGTGGDRILRSNPSVRAAKQRASLWRAARSPESRRARLIAARNSQKRASCALAVSSAFSRLALASSCERFQSWQEFLP
jgi:hypothetical protein